MNGHSINHLRLSFYEGRSKSEDSRPTKNERIASTSGIKRATVEIEKLFSGLIIGLIPNECVVPFHSRNEEYSRIQFDEINVISMYFTSLVLG